MRRAHFLPGNKSNEIPSNCIWVDTETQPIINDEGEEEHRLWFGWACYRRRKSNDHWCAPVWFRFESVTEFWDWVESIIRAKTRLYMFAHNGAFDLPVLNAFTQLPGRGYVMRKAIVEAPPIIIKWVQGKTSIQFVDTLNIWRMPLADIGESIGLDKLPMPAPDAARADWDAYGQQDTRIIMEACLSWFQFLREHDLGGFQPTLASQAFGAFRHRFMHQQIFIDAQSDALQIARDAYKGARTECFRIGTFSGPLYHLDINSMYPKVMHDSLYPAVIIGLYKTLGLDKLPQLLDEYCVVANVTIQTRSPVYPLMMDKKLVFPVGTFDTTLSTPELSHALGAGHIKTVREVVLYDRQPLFREFVDYMYTQRLSARAKGNEVDAWRLKIFQNSLYGKFCQRGRRYETAACELDNNIRVWKALNADTGEVVQYRQFGGQLQILKEESESFNSHPAIGAHVTAYARMMLWDLYNLARRKNVYYSDTDCVIVNQAGYDRLKHLIDPTELGALKLEATYSTLTIHGCKDYMSDSVYACKGVRKDALWLNPNTVEQAKFVGFKGLLRRGHLDAPIVTKQVKHLKRIYSKGRVQTDGRILPLLISAR